MMRFWRLIGLSLAGAAVALTGGCAGGTADSDAADAVPLLEAKGPIGAAGLVTGGAARLMYRSKSGKPRTAIWEHVDVLRPGVTWWVRYYGGEPGVAKAEREFRLAVDEAGNIAQSEEINRIDMVEVEYTPPLVILPVTLAPGPEGEFTQRVRMVVHPLGDRTRTRASGQARSEIRYDGDARLSVGSRTVLTHKLVATLTADLAPAKTIDTNEQWWATGIGLVKQREREVTTVMGAKVRDNKSAMTLRSYEK